MEVSFLFEELFDCNLHYSIGFNKDKFNRMQTLQASNYTQLEKADEGPHEL